MNNRSAKKKGGTDFGHQLVRGIWRIGKEIVRLKQPLVENTVVITGGSPRHKLHTPFGRCCGARIFRKLVADRETAGPHANLRRWRAPLLQCFSASVLHCSVPETPPESEFPRVLVTADAGKEGKVCEGEPGPQREFATRKLLKNWPDTHLKISF